MRRLPRDVFASSNRAEAGRGLERVPPRPSANRTYCPQTRSSFGPFRARHADAPVRGLSRPSGSPRAGRAPLQTRLIAAGAIAESGVYGTTCFHWLAAKGSPVTNCWLGKPLRGRSVTARVRLGAASRSCAVFIATELNRKHCSRKSDHRVCHADFRAGRE